MVDHVVLFTVRGDADQSEVEDMLDSLRGLRESVPGVLDLTVGENFSERAGGYTHGLFGRFRTHDDLQGYIKHPDHLAAVEKLERLTTGRIVVDYEHEG